ncbi:hypothetical protein [Actinomadura sp. 9N215]|uniref:hypothetical protein n=1 Tax=Actinomadura sp. 9N215 TaxID=3375150 RepID=UPI0037BC69DB
MDHHRIGQPRRATEFDDFRQHGGMAQTLLPSRHTALLCAAVYAVLLTGTGVASVLLISRGIEQGLEVWPDAQMDTQMVAAWRGAAICGHTSGSGVGLICALLSGLLVARAAADRSRRTGTALSVAAGTVLALVNLSLAWWKASPRLTHMTGAVDASAIDTDLRHHTCVIVAIALVFAAYLVVAAAGYLLGRARNVMGVALTLAVLVVLVPHGQFGLATTLVPSPEF